MSGVGTESGEGIEGATESEVARHAIGYAPEPALRRPPLPLGMIAAIGIAAVAGLGLLGWIHSSSSAAPVAFQDMGEAVSNATGLRGSLKARWQGKTAEYQLEIEPVTPYASAGFSWVAAHPPGPLLLHIKLVDTTGYILCGRDVLFPLGPPDSGAAQPASGQDRLQAQVDDNGKIASLTAQGTLPCTPQQYKQADHWDFSTDFPVLAEQDVLMKQTAERKARQEAQKRRALERRRQARSAFYTEGDDQATSYDAARNVLQTQLGRNFLVGAPGQRAMARMWASSGVLFRYNCDQHSHCVLTRAGGTQSLPVTALQ